MTKRSCSDPQVILTDANLLKPVELRAMKYSSPATIVLVTTGTAILSRNRSITAGSPVKLSTRLELYWSTIFIHKL